MKYMKQYAKPCSRWMNTTRVVVMWYLNCGIQKKTGKPQWRKLLATSWSNWRHQGARDEEYEVLNQYLLQVYICLQIIFQISDFANCELLVCITDLQLRRCGCNSRSKSYVRPWHLHFSQNLVDETRRVLLSTYLLILRV